MPAQRRADLTAWVVDADAAGRGAAGAAQLLRDSGAPQKVLASGGQYPAEPAARQAYQLLRVRLDRQPQLVPEISGHRLMVSIRLMRPEADGRLRPSQEDAAFELTLCA